MKQKPPRVYGDTNGDLYNFVQLWTTLELNMWEATCRESGHNIKKYHNITEDWEGQKYADINLKWDYDKRICRAAMYGYILDLRNKF